MTGADKQVGIPSPGNARVFQDLPARKAGFLTYFVGQALPGLDTGPSGHLKDFPEWLQAQDIRQASGTYKPL